MCLGAGQDQDRRELQRGGEDQEQERQGETHKMFPVGRQRLLYRRQSETDHKGGGTVHHEAQQQ